MLMYSHISERLQIRPTGFYQSSLYADKTADLAFDRHLNTNAHTLCSFNVEETIWFNMTFGTLECFEEIVLIQAAMDDGRLRMDDTKVLVVNSTSGEEYLCGMLKTREGETIEDQTYKIPCSGTCGDEVKLTLKSQGQDHGACIHVKEIYVFGIGPGLY